MRICVIGECDNNNDEGMKKTTYYVSRGLSIKHEVLLVNPKDVSSKSFWLSIKRFSPQIIHYIPGPSIFSFIILKMLSVYCSNAITVMSAMHPAFYGLNGLRYGLYNAISSLLSPLIPILKPNLVLTQSYKSNAMFSKAGCITKFLPSGVDTDKFVPVSDSKKSKLRTKYEIDTDKFIVLHVGSVKKWRNVEILKRLQVENTQMLIVGSTSTGVDDTLQSKLIEQGCLVWTNYIKNIEEIYGLSDCYIFPTMEDKIGSIEMPLSVLEAMSCNLPVISTKFGALSKVFQEGDGLIFASNEEDFQNALATFILGRTKIKTRDKIIQYSWPNVIEKLEGIYEQLLYG